MFLFKRASDIQLFLASHRTNHKRIGFVPTMGALHEGHLSLIRQAKDQTDLVVCTIFVNPTQFNESSDLEKYPRREAADIELLLSVHCDVLFLPPVNEVYPEQGIHTPDFNFHPMDSTMEGAHRPGHFAGVAQVLHRFKDILEPHAMFMGQKDLQQFFIVKSMLQQIASDMELVMCPIIREADGLAMSSRNRRLSSDDRKAAAGIQAALQEAVKWKTSGLHPSEIAELVFRKLEKNPLFKPEYVEVVETGKLQRVERFSEDEEYAICTAVWVGGIRLIDNLLL